jgi:hypothetical protein
MRRPFLTLIHLALLPGLLAAQGSPGVGPGTDAAGTAANAAAADTTTSGPLAGFALLAISDGRRVLLRWAPGATVAWEAGNKHGYVVERLRADGAGGKGFEVLTPEPLRPWPLEVWARHVGPQDQWGALAAQMLHGKVEIPVDSRRPLIELRDRAALLQNRHGFSLFAADMDSIAATGLALRFVDEMVESGADYIYRVHIPRPPADTLTTPRGFITVDTAYAVVRVEPLGRVLGPPDLRALPGDGRIGLTWGVDPLMVFSGYHVERSDDGGAKYSRLSEAPVVRMLEVDDPDAPLFIDTTAVNGHTYHYRVIGITPFATLSETTEVEGMARDLTPPPLPVFESADPVHDATVRLRWKLDPVPPDLVGFLVGIGDDPEGPFRVDSGPPLPPTAREALDSRGVAGIPNYYTIFAVDTAGNASWAVPVAVHPVDSIPPAPPTGLEAAIDSAGGLLITWNRGPEPDLLGWRVYRLNQEDHIPTLQTGEPTIFPYFEDSIPLRTLTRALYYEVVALDRSHNPSAPTRIRVEIPDIVAPVPPLLQSATPSETTVTLAWIPSPSEDVERVIILRRVGDSVTPEDSAWSELATLRGGDTTFADTAVAPGTSYAYTLLAVDSAGLRSEPGVILTARPYGSALRPGVEALRGTMRDGMVVLEWDDPAPAGSDRWFVVYRAAGDAPLGRYATADSATFIDAAVAPNTTYRYAVQLYYRDGARTRRSEPRAVTPD